MTARQDVGGSRRLEAVIFDVDGTLVDSEREGHRVAFNRAFEQFDLPWRWDDVVYGELLHVTGGQRRLDLYLADKGVADDERADLVAGLHGAKTAIFESMVEDGAIEARPGVARLLAELTDAGCRLAIGTTGSRGWVDGLLHRVFPAISWDVVITGEDVTERKPSPEVFDLVVARLGLDDPGGAVVVEDSAAGLTAAIGAHLACAVVVNGYTTDHDRSGADLVLDGFGVPGSPSTVLSDPHDTGCTGILDGAVLRMLLPCRT